MSTLASQTPGRADADSEDQTCSKVTWRLMAGAIVLSLQRDMTRR